MTDQRSRLQLLDELARLEREHIQAAGTLCAAPGSADAPGELWERYSYGQLQVIADFLAADLERLQALGDPQRR